ncbi:NPCBM/NEW2 domain-containing protein [Kutzneria sp. CA-103260]|uniref:NPCBM/NEW2 domain-containing protein n=1 Tax=Kutzneria sp. CA-103260 TaxID=2802641 RepID=UPI001BA8A181|nr:NPCBM/NEW2 domain-containing protein [Kutzneria sp. CA-103260]QUQ62677.1 alpha-galactosidase [Kutzneria sp. CA-103260]
MSVRLRLAALGVAAATAAAGLALVTAPAAVALDNGLARTPQMGFNNWNATHCSGDFNETMVKGIADLFVSSGLKAAGYQYVNLDDCWALPARDAGGNLVPDPVRFPDGIKAVADYVHAKGLKFGLYSSAGTKTCNTAGFPGGLGHEKQDAALWASWGVDYLKYDNCNNQGVDAVQRYTAMRDALAATGRPILYSLCEWGQNQPWNWATSVGNSWRTTGDINDTYAKMLSIFKANIKLGQYAGPGHWNDPDMLEVGNGGMTDTEYRSHFSLWSIMASPLLIGSDIRKATPATMAILTNKDVIAVDQDPLGVQGTELSNANGLHVISKPLAGGDRAVALFNENGTPATISTTAAAVGLPKALGYQLNDLWSHKTTETAGKISATVPAHGTAMFRVHAGGAWWSNPPAVHTSADLPLPYPGAPALVQPGTTTTLTTTTTNDGVLPGLLGEVKLTGPAGWTVKATSPTFHPVLPAGRDVSTKWSVSTPADTPPGSYPLHVSTTYYPGKSTSDYDLTVSVAAPLTAGTTGLGDDPWLSADNGYGPVERNTSNGESKAGDGHPITLGGVTYAKGLGVNAPSTITYYPAGHCSAVTATVGLDDEKTGAGSVTFEIWADGNKVADTGLIKRGDPAQSLHADVTGAGLLRLIVTDGGDGNTNDHADWANAQITC